MHLCFCWRVKSNLLTLFLSKLGSPARWRGWHFDCRLLSDDRPSQLIRCGGQESWDRRGSLSSRSQYLCSLRSTSKSGKCTADLRYCTGNELTLRSVIFSLARKRCHQHACLRCTCTQSGHCTVP